jgi:Ni,Fe-hydrogenase III small subunit
VLFGLTIKKAALKLGKLTEQLRKPLERQYLAIPEVDIQVAMLMKRLQTARD